MSDVAPRVAAIVAAGGTGSRFGAVGGKQLARLAGRAIVEHTLRAVASARSVDVIVVVCDSRSLRDLEELVASGIGSDTPVRVVPGGATRRESVAAGLSAVPDVAEVVLVHDGARPLVTSALIERVLREFDSADTDGLVVGHPSVDTIKVVSDRVVTETPDRSALWAVQTPQVFSAKVLREAHRVAGRDDFEGTDDASLVERIGGRVHVFEGPRDNIKITTVEDIVCAEAVLAARDGEGR